MTWQQALMGYAACGVAAYVVVMLGIHYVESKTPAGVWKSMGDNLGRWAEEIEQRKNPSRLRWLKNASAKWVAHCGVAALVVTVWPAALLIKARVWYLQLAQAGVHIRNIQYIAKDIGLPLVEGGGLTLGEKVLVLFWIDDHKFNEVPGLDDLKIQATELFLFKLNELFLDALNFLDLSSDELKLFCKDQKLSDEDEGRVMRWVSWSKSAEAITLKDRLEQLAQQQKHANSECPTEHGRWFPKAVVELALAKSHRRCCVCHDFNAPSVGVSFMTGAPDSVVRTIEHAVCLCDKCYKIWSFQMHDALEPKYLKLKAKRDKWWEHCHRHPEEPYGLFLDVGFKAISKTADVHCYRLVATYTNTTKKVQEGWQLNIKIPGLLPLRYENYDRSEKRIVGADVSDPPHAQLTSSSTARIMPGESVDIVPLEVRYIEYELNEKVYNRLIAGWIVVSWEFTIPNSPRIEGEKKLFELQDWHQRKMAA